jgi:uncharacterized RDD family membrane protein YckC
LTLMSNEIALNSESVSEPTPESRAAIAIAAFWGRILALLIDTIILGVVGIIFGFLFFDQLAGLGVWGRLVGFSIALLYFGLLNSRVGKGQTVGKRIMKIKVVGRDGQFISVARSFLRYSVLGLPYFLNGAMIPPSILMKPIGVIVYLLIFGFGGAIIYLYIQPKIEAVAARSDCGHLCREISIIRRTEYFSYMERPSLHNRHIPPPERYSNRGHNTSGY